MAKTQLKEQLEFLKSHTMLVGGITLGGHFDKRVVHPQHLPVDSNIAMLLVLIDAYGAHLSSVVGKRIRNNPNIADHAKRKITQNIRRQFSMFGNVTFKALYPHLNEHTTWRKRPWASEAQDSELALTETASAVLALGTSIAYRDVNSLASVILRPVLELIAKTHTQTVGARPGSKELCVNSVAEWASDLARRDIGTEFKWQTSPVPGKVTTEIAGIITSIMPSFEENLTLVPELEKGRYIQDGQVITHDHVLKICVAGHYVGDGTMDYSKWINLV